MPLARGSRQYATAIIIQPDHNLVCRYSSYLCSLSRMICHVTIAPDMADSLSPGKVENRHRDIAAPSSGTDQSAVSIVFTHRGHGLPANGLCHPECRRLMRELYQTRHQLISLLRRNKPKTSQVIACAGISRANRATAHQATNAKIHADLSYDVKSRINRTGAAGWLQQTMNPPQPL